MWRRSCCRSSLCTGPGHSLLRLLVEWGSFGEKCLRSDLGLAALVESPRWKFCRRACHYSDGLSCLVLEIQGKYWTSEVKNCQRREWRWPWSWKQMRRELACCEQSDGVGMRWSWGMYWVGKEYVVEYMGGKAGLFMHISAGEGHVISITYVVEERLQSDVICTQSGGPEAAA